MHVASHEVPLTMLLVILGAIGSGHGAELATRQLKPQTYLSQPAFPFKARTLIEVKVQQTQVHLVLHVLHSTLGSKLPLYQFLTW